jgi:AcrR family transcriptional regulator
VDNRSTILDTATRLFAEQGFAGVSLRAIAERVGITKPSLLYHFHSKDALREEVLGNLFEHWATRLPRLLRAVTSGEGELEALMDALWDFFAEDPDRARLVARELLDRPDELRARVGESLVPLVLLVAGRMKKGQETGLLRAEVDPEAFALHMISMTVSTIAAAPALGALSGGDTVRATERQRQELKRIAYVSLFPDRAPAGSLSPAPSTAPAPPIDPPTGTVRSS